jgi:hypothetical protein
MWRCRHVRTVPRVFAVLLIALLCFAGPASVWSQGLGSITGEVRVSDTSIPLPDAAVTVSGTNGVIRSGGDGQFTIPSPIGIPRTLIVRRIGYRPDTLHGIIARGAVTRVVVRLTRLDATLDTVAVRSLATSIDPAGAVPSVHLSRDDIERMPQVVDDAFRAVTRVPGVSASDLSAGFRVRGGANREVLLSLDGMELFEPFHLKDLDGALSIIDPAIVGGADISTGGFGARYGDHLTGVFALRSRDDPVTAVHGNLTARLSGVSGEVVAPLDGQWADVLVSARRGLLGTALSLAGEGGVLAPRYDDSYARIQVRLTSHDHITISALRSRDGLFFNQTDQPRLASLYGSSYAWVTWDALPLPWLSARTTLSSAHLGWERTGGEASSSGLWLNVDDRRRFQARTLSQDWTASVGPHWRTTFGASFRDLAAQYAYAREQLLPEVQSHEWVTRANDYDTRFDTHGNTVGAYLSQFVQPTAALSLEAGIRYDRQSYTGEHTLSPRAALSYAIDARTSVHAAWGRYAQPQSLYELQVEDGVTSFATAERAEHRIVGIDRRVGSGQGVLVRVEAYDRELLHIDPEYVNLESSFDVFPEAGNDRVLISPVRGSAKGIEFSATSGHGPVQWSASYALASSRQVVNGVSLPSPYDERHAVHLDGSFSPLAGWRVSASWQLHSGWPATPISFTVDSLVDGSHHVRAQYGTFNTTRIGPYHRLDMRVSNTRRLGPGELSVYVDVFNVYGRNNPRGLGYTVADWNSAEVVANERSRLQLPRIPTIGVRWTF